MADATAKFFDLQVNGYGGTDFNQDDLSPQALNLACRRLDQDGVGAVLATLITDRFDLMLGRLKRLVQLRADDPLAGRMIDGIHLEGPFLDPSDGYRGAHPLEAILPADEDLMHRLLDAAGGLLRLVTLAPEHDAGQKVTRLLVRNGVTVSAGHCNPSLDQLRQAIDAGLSMFTHLGNACPAQLPRHDNIIQRALHLRDKLYLCFIADGVHLPKFVLRNFLDLVDPSRCIIVTDAIAPAGLGPGTYTLGSRRVTLDSEGIARLENTPYLVGSATTMTQSLRTLVDMGLPQSTAMRMMTENPRLALAMPGT